MNSSGFRYVPSRCFAATVTDHIHRTSRNSAKFIFNDSKNNAVQANLFTNIVRIQTPHATYASRLPTSFKPLSQVSKLSLTLKLFWYALINRFFYNEILCCTLFKNERTETRERCEVMRPHHGGDGSCYYSTLYLCIQKWLQKYKCGRSLRSRSIGCYLQRQLNETITELIDNQIFN